MGVGIKYDHGKPNWYLLPLQPIREAVEVLTISNESGKYPEYNWQQVDPKKYWSACFRHLDYYQGGEQHDPETGKSHLAHALVNIIFLLWFELTKGVYLWRANDEMPIKTNESVREPDKRSFILCDEYLNPIDDLSPYGYPSKVKSSIWDRLFVRPSRTRKTDDCT